MKLAKQNKCGLLLFSTIVMYVEERTDVVKMEVMLKNFSGYVALSMEDLRSLDFA